MADIPSEKKSLRATMLKQREEQQKADRNEKSRAICAFIEMLSEYRQARCVLYYMPIGGEVDVEPLLRRALEAGKACALPRCAPGRTLSLFTVQNPSGELSPGTFGIQEPADDSACACMPEDVDLILVPGVAYVRQGQRLGRGAGYYDRLLAGGAKSSLKIAPAFAFQVVDALPCEPNDAPVDIIVTEEGILDCRNYGGNDNG